MTKEFDFVVFGSTGITGVYVVEELLKYNKDTGSNIKWAVAGRDKLRTKFFLTESFTNAGFSASDADSITIFEANTDDQQSLEKVTASARLLLNCVGPFALHGEPVVKACINTGTDYVDVTGEPLFMEKMQLNYFNLAKEKGVHIISACGFDSVPADIGVNYLKDQFSGGALNSVETFCRLIASDNEKLVVNHATWDCIVEGFTSTDELKRVRRQLFPQLFENISKFRSSFGLKRKSFFKNATGYCLPFPGSDRSVVKRSQYHNYLFHNERPTEMEAYAVITSLKALILMVFYGLLVSLFLPFRCGRALLHKWPEFFTHGVFSKKGPTRAESKAGIFEVVFNGNGWSSPLADPLEQRSTPTDKRVVTRVSGVGCYESTAVILVQCAVTLLEERDKMPNNGGVWTPGIAYRKTTLIERLMKRGVKFEVISSN